MTVAKTIKCVEGARLAYYMTRANADYWDAHWKGRLNERIYHAVERGHLGQLKPIARYLPGDGKILEAGCGMGQYVLALRARGYDAEGVDFGAETVTAVKRLRPDLPVRVGDVTCLNVPDAYYAGYLSLGVVEHRQEGPQPFLREAWRVLRPGGVALISVPHFHAFRRWKARRGLYRQQKDTLGNGNLDFYQYAFQVHEFRQLLEQAGFEFIASFPYGAAKGIRDEAPFLKRLFDLRGFHRLVERPLRRYGHMLMTVSRKPLLNVAKDGCAGNDLCQ